MATGIAPQPPPGGMGGRQAARWGQDKLSFCFGKYQVNYVEEGGYLQWVVASSSWQIYGMQRAVKVIYSVPTLLSDLKFCSMRRDLQEGRRIHLKAVESRHASSMFVVTAIIRMYAKCGSMVDAHHLFDSIPKPDVVSWNVLILGYAENGEGRTALDCFSNMNASGCVPNSLTYIAAIKACSCLAVKRNDSGECLKRGREIHSEINCHLNVCVQSALIDMYGKCGSMVDARRVFDSIEKPDVVCWNVLLLGYAENGEGHAALELFSRMKECGCCAPVSVTYIAILKACMALGEQGECLKRGRQIHSEICCDLEISVRNTLIDMYSKCGSMGDARSVFENIKKPDVVSWNILLLGYVQNGDGLTALNLFSRIDSAPNSLTYIAALKACTSLVVKQDDSGYDDDECLKWGRKIHSEIGRHLDQCVQSSLIDMYGKCGSMTEARLVFEDIQQPNVVCWNALLLGYAENGDRVCTLDMFARMKAYGCKPDSVTYVAALKACTCLGDGGTDHDRERGECLKVGVEIHSEIGRHMDDYLQTALIDMYCKCGSMVDARRVFGGIQKPDVVAWTALILGYTENGDGFTSLELFSRMKSCGCTPDSVTYIAALKACGSIGALVLGREFHAHIREFTPNVVTCLVDFYAKCGSMREASEVFNTHSTLRILPTWNALLAGYGSFGDIDSMFKVMEAMQEQGFKPNCVTLVCLLSCCGHAGLVEKAKEYVEKMGRMYGVSTNVMHYNCMVDVFVRANRVNEAIDMFGEFGGVDISPDAVTWMTVLGACRKWKNVEIGRFAFECLVDIEKKNKSAYIVMGQIYASLGMWDEQQKVLENLKEYT